MKVKTLLWHVFVTQAPFVTRVENNPNKMVNNRVSIEPFVVIIYNITLLPSVNTLIARGIICGAKYIHHTFTPIIKHRVVAVVVVLFFYNMELEYQYM